MGRNILETMGSIFDTLKLYIVDDDLHRIVDVKRHIKVDVDEALLCEFIKTAKMKIDICNGNEMCLFKYNNQEYILFPEKFSNSLHNIGFDFEMDATIVMGVGMLAIAQQLLPIKVGLSSLTIIEQCLGVTAFDINDLNISFNFSTISDFFQPYCLVKRDDSRFQLAYEEDFNRLYTYLLIKDVKMLSTNSQERIQDLMLLLSSRSIAGSILNSIQSSLIEYTFL